ncbi:MAG: sulfoxide reductase heme-binding subunit YedZ [Burkholderiales bacterium]|nr:sulfoxide reductase heme-binding subunit YedZ [Burkholderiales bacterium]
MPAALPAATFNRLWWVLLAVALLPLGRLVVLIATNDLGANPVEFVIRSLGTWTLVLLCVTLAVSPLRQLTGWTWLVRLRRMFGLICFAYATLHMLAFVGLDQAFDFSAVWTEVVKRPYVTAGMAAFLLLVPLAVTSTNGMVRRLGGRAWQRLHRLVYLIALLAILHYWWHKAGKNDFSEVMAYAAVIGVLLGFRVWRWLGTRAAEN